MVFLLPGCLGSTKCITLWLDLDLTPEAKFIGIFQRCRLFLRHTMLKEPLAISFMSPISGAP
jgi:hypothetical protein